MRTALLLAALTLSAVLPAGAQQITFVPRPEVPEERQLARFLEGEAYRVVARDTVLGPADSVDTSLLVLEATVRLAGRVAGSVYVVNGDLFLRSDARVAGDVLALGGGYYSSSMAEVDGATTYRPNLLLRVIPRDGGWEIFHVKRPVEAVDLDGLGGFHAPTYQRVDGWTFGWGGRATATGVPGQPSVQGAVRVHTEGRQALEGTLRHFWHPAAAWRVGLEAERATRTSDGWIRGDVSNSLSYLFGDGDFRDYYRAESGALVLEGTRPEGWVPSLRLQVEEARNLTARPLTVFFRDDEDVRSNPPVDEGTVWSARAGLAFRRRTASSRFMATARAEAADSTVAGDFSFVLTEGRLSWRRPGLAAHRLEIYAIGRAQLAGTLPRQRWSALGGIGTLPTLDDLEMRGQHLAFASATYLVPVEGLRVPILGPPRVFLRNAVGSAWRDGGTLTVEDNLMLGVRFFVLETGFALNPTEADLDPELVLGGSFPGRFWR